ncbi:MAG: MMPL family transporter [Deltaproteobacteria bacterium]|nr:MMPL family transporter [Deltaproteobacteria bacterium]
MFEQLADFVLGHRRLVAVFSGVLFLVVTAGAANLKVDFSVMAFFGGDDPERIHFQEYKEHWGADDNVVLVVVTADEGNLLTLQRLRRLRSVEDALLKNEMVSKVMGIVDVPLPEAGAAIIDSRPIFDRMPTSDDDFATFRKQVLSHPVYVPSLLAADATATALVVETKVSSDDIEAIQPLMKSLRATLAEHEDKDGLSYSAAGLPAVRADFFSAFMKDQGLFLPLGMLLIVLVLIVVFRSVHGVMIPAVAATIPMMMTFGLMGWLGEPMGIINQAYTILLPAIAVADAIHLVSRFHEEARKLATPGEKLSAAVRNQAIQKALEHIGAACALTTLTTAIGFGSLAIARMPSMRTFGLYAAAGIVFAYGTLLFIVPLMLAFVRGPMLDAGSEKEPNRVDRLLLGCARFSVERPVVVLVATVGVALLFAGFGTRTVVDNHLTNMLKPAHETTKANHIMDEKLGGILTAEIDIQGKSGALIESKVLQAMLDVEEWSKSEPSVRAAISPATFVVSLQESLVGKRELPETSSGVAQLLLLAAGNDDLSSLISSDRSRGRMVLRTKDEGGVVFTALVKRIRTQLEKSFADTEVSAHLTGTVNVAYRGINNVTGDLRSSLLLAFLVIAAIIGLLLRNVWVALVCLLPNGLPLVVGYGFLGMTGWLLEPSGAVIFTVALGIAVDDTLHLIVRTREELKKGLGLHQALKLSVLHSGRAVMVTSWILCGGFGVLCLSSFPATVLMGALGFAVIFTALLCDLFVLPALLALFGRSLER